MGLVRSGTSLPVGNARANRGEPHMGIRLVVIDDHRLLAEALASALSS